MKNRPKPNRAAYASNGTPTIKKSTDTPPLETAAQAAPAPEPTKAELEKHVEQRNVKVKVLSAKDVTKAEVIQPKAEKELNSKDLD